MDQLYHLHLQAYLNVAAQAEKQVGKKRKKVYDRFSKFFDYEKALSDIAEGKIPKKKEMNVLDRVSEFLKKQEKEN